MLDRNTRIAFLCDRLGPYHHARFSALAGLVDPVVVEFSLSDETYAWDLIQSNACYRRVTLFSDKPIGMHSGKTIAARVMNVMSDLAPDIVVIPGWDAPASLVALQWCLDSGTPTILLSDSQEKDMKRVWWKEWIKSKIVRLHYIGFVAGKSHSDYLVNLGLPLKKIFTGFDVVDNEHFAVGAALARSNADKLRAEKSLPERYFLNSSRFQEKKNLVRLIDAYAIYCNKAGGLAFHMVILGDGPLRPQLERQIVRLGLESRVHLPSFKQYDELTAYYGLAGAYIQASTTEQWGLVVNEAMASGLSVLVSNRCGCAPDLVKEGLNGYTFDPYDVNELADLMIKLSSDDILRAKMGQESSEIISHWTPETFAENLLKAAKSAKEVPPPKCYWLDRSLLRLLCHR